MSDEFYEMKKARDVARELHTERTKLYSKQKLLNMLRKKFNTAIIGALASFEEHFGALWGHGKHPDDLNESELEFKKLWDAARTEILDKGNTQSRSALSELSNYDTQYQKNRYNFVVKKDKQDE